MRARAFGACSLLLACLSSALGCASFPRPAQPFTDPEAALGLQRATSEQVNAIRAEARVDQRGARGRIKGTVLMFVRRPASVRFDAMTQFGPAAILTSDGDQFAYSDLREHRFLTGPTCPKNIARFLNFALSVDQTTLLLLGGTPLIEHVAQTISWDDHGFYRLVLRARGGARQEIDLGIDPSDAALPPSQQHLHLLRSEIYGASGHSLIRLRYDDYRAIPFGREYVAMPFIVHVEQRSNGSDTLIHFKQLSFDSDIPADAFTQAPLPGMNVEEASCD